jgi:hypothetical protein
MSQQSDVTYLELLKNKHEIIFEGRIISESTNLKNSKSSIFTLYKISVDNLLAGKEDKVIAIKVPGGRYNNQIDYYSHTPRLSVGEKGVFLISENNRLNHFDAPTYLFNNNENFLKNVGQNKLGNVNRIFSISKPEILNKLAGKVLQSKQSNVLNNIKKKNRSFPSIAKFEPQTIRAGTYDTLTIYGSGFGNNNNGIGKIYFKDGDSGVTTLPSGTFATWISAFSTDIIYWTDTEIKLRVRHGASTYKIKVDVDGEELTAIESADILNIQYNKIGGEIQREDDELNLLDYSAQYIIPKSLEAIETPLVWRLDSEFFNNNTLKNIVIDLVDNWACSSGINWILNLTSSINENSDTNSGVNSIGFGDSSEVGSLGVCKISGYISSNSDENGFNKIIVAEMDIRLREDINWSYSGWEENKYNIINTLNHELGHALGFGHVSGKSNLMYPTSTTGEETYVNNDQDRINGQDLISIYTSTNLSGNINGTSIENISENNFDCYQSLSLSNIILYENFKLIPSLVKNSIKINQPKRGNYNCSIYNINGALVYKFYNLNKKNESLDISDLSSGIHFVVIEVSNKKISKKFIKL